MAKLPRPEAPAVFRALFPGLVDWLESPWAGPPQFTAAQSFRVEEVARDNRYLIRAELPGLDPEKDIEVTVEGTTLTIQAERRQEDSGPIAQSSATARSPGWSGCPSRWTPRTSPPATRGESSRSVSRRPR
jgi:HSP20 family molecular chaperone IbpA